MPKKKLDRNAVKKLLSYVDDPSLGGDIISLGLVKQISHKGSKWLVKFKPHNPFDPLASDIARKIKDKLKDCEIDAEVLVTDHKYAKEINEYVNDPHKHPWKKPT